MKNYSVCSTIYNNANRVEQCLKSILRALKENDFEIVIVDQYSNDGSYEILLEYSRRYSNIKVFRHKRSSRGEGRQLAFKLSKGRYIINIDADTIYDSQGLSELITAYEYSSFKDKKGFKTGWPMAAGCLGIYPRQFVEEVGGWRKYDKHEDVDFLTRLFMYDRVIYVPIILEENEPSPYTLSSREKDSLKAEIGIIDRYSRYAKGLGLVQKALWHKFNLYCACNYTLRKLVLRNRHRGIQLPLTYLAVIFLFFTKLTNYALKLPIAVADTDLINFDYIYYKSLKTMIDPSKLDLTKATNIHQYLYKDVISFIARFKPDIIDDLYRIRKGG